MEYFGLFSSSGPTRPMERCWLRGLPALRGAVDGLGPGPQLAEVILEGNQRRVDGVQRATQLEEGVQEGSLLLSFAVTLLRIPGVQLLEAAGHLSRQPFAGAHRRRPPRFEITEGT